MTETLEEEEAAESGIALGVASSPADITTALLHTLYRFQSTYILSVRG